jgi:hypothetical protein
MEAVVLLASVAACVIDSGLVRRALSDLALPPASCVGGGRWPLPFRPARVAEVEIPLGPGVVPHRIIFLARG